MKFDGLKTRRGKLIKKLSYELEQSNPNIQNILQFIDEYEQSNLDTIKKLKRKQIIDIKKINGALKQTINAHSPITKELIGSASKRIYGALLEQPNKSFFSKLLNIFKWTTKKK